MRSSLLAILACAQCGVVSSVQQLGNPLDDFSDDTQYSSLTGMSFSYNGSVVAIGDIRCNLIIQGEMSGCTRIYQWNGTLWNQLGDPITGISAYDFSGSSVSLSGNGRIVAIGEPGPSDVRARVFEWNDITWNQKGNTIEGYNPGYIDTNAKFHVSISNDGTIVAIGSRIHDENGYQSGRVRIFQYNTTHWQQMGQTILGDDAGDEKGTSVSLSDDGTVVAMGAPGNGNAGLVRVFKWNGTAWNQRGSDINSLQFDSFGKIVSLSGDGNRVAVSGAVYTKKIQAYEWNNTDWTEFGQKISMSSITTSDSMVLSSSGTRLAVGTRNKKALIYDIIDDHWTLNVGIALEDSTKMSYGKYTSLSGDGSTVALSSIINESYPQQVELFEIPAVTSSPTLTPPSDEESEPDAALIGGIAGGVGGAVLLGGVVYYVYAQYYRADSQIVTRLGQLVF